MREGLMVLMPLEGAAPLKGPRYTFGGRAFAFARDGSTYASIDGLVEFAPDGLTAWTQNVPASGYPAMSSDGTLYVGGNGILAAVNPDGTGKWSYALPDHLVFSPSIAADGTIY